MNRAYMKLAAWKLLRRFEADASSPELAGAPCKCRLSYAGGVANGARQMWTLIEEHLKLKQGERHADF
jgi:hypothetical protein